MTETELQTIIERAFLNVPFPESQSLRQGRMLDDWNEDRQAYIAAREKDLYGDWSFIPDSDIREYGDAFFFLDADGKRYYLPAVMSYCLRLGHHHDRNISILLSDFSANDATAADGPFHLLNDAQRSSVVAFLEWCVDYSADKFIENTAKVCLRQWVQFKDWTF